MVAVPVLRASWDRATAVLASPPKTQLVRLDDDGTDLDQSVFFDSKASPWVAA